MEKDTCKDILKVRIRKDLTVDYETVNVRLSTLDEIEWCTEGSTVIIDFDRDRKPFADAHFEVTPEQPIRSGYPTGGVGYYDYSIRSAVLEMSADPGVSIKP